MLQVRYYVHVVDISIIGRIIVTKVFMHVAVIPVLGAHIIKMNVPRNLP